MLANSLWVNLFIACLFSLVSCTTTADEQQTGKGIQVNSHTPKVNKRDSIPPKSKVFSFSIDYLTGKFDPATHPDFVKVENKYADREGLYLRKDTYEAFKKMYASAKTDGVQLVIRSATRNFDYQKGIWEAKWSGKRKVEDKNLATSIKDPTERALKILEYSSMPGTSRHHWGTDMDLNAFANSFFEKGEGLKIYEWLSQHASEYGFCQPYSPKGTERPYGYNEEKWHWSYLPIAKQLTDQAKAQLKNEMISGFRGAETVTSINVVEKYVLGINQECL